MRGIQRFGRDRQAHGASVPAYHAGEIAAQERAGVRPLAERSGQGIHCSIPPVGAAFLRTRDLAFVATTDNSGQPWASLITGAPGFLDPIDEWTVRIGARPTDDDPLVEHLQTGGHIGLLAMDFSLRRRMRVNGTAERQEDGSIQLRVDQVYSNCAKYIQVREVKLSTEKQQRPARGEWVFALRDEHRAWIQRADTFFIATAVESGADISHRGGNPGFVHVEGNRLVWGDYHGNSMFNTLGNVAINPRAALLFVDFEHGRTLQLTGKARIDWSVWRAAQIPGAERVLEFDAERAFEREHALPQRLQLVQCSPFNADLV